MIRTWVVVGMLLCGSVIADTSVGNSAAVSVSPGGIEAPTWLTDPCPTFSWGAVPEAAGYELAVFGALDDVGAGYDAQHAQGEPVLETRVAAPALSWIPDADSCLAVGGRYLWFVRAFDEWDSGPWSAARFFEMDLSGGILVDAVRAEVTALLSEPATWEAVVREVLRTSPGATLRLPALERQVRETRVDKVIETIDPDSGLRIAPERQIAAGVAASRQYLKAFHTSSANGVLFGDPTGGGGIPAEGAGTRFMWYPGKRALRSGDVSGAQWDDANIGDSSTAMGENTTASGNFSTALGFGTTASGDLSTALGSSTTASGVNSTAMGVVTTASGVNSTAMGSATTASGVNSTALGRFTTAESYGETVLGQYDTDYIPDSATTWDSSDRLFVVGNGSSSSARHDALVMRKDGITTLNGELNLNGWVTVDALTVTYLGSTISDDPVCRSGNTISYCSSSARYKEAVAQLELGLETVERLNPVIFKWKEREDYDLGFVAEEVAEIAPLLATYNEKGEIEGVKYRQLTAVLVNAIKEQQEQIEEQREQIDIQRQAHRIAEDWLETQQIEMAELRRELQQYRALAEKVSAIERQLAQKRAVLAKFSP